MIGAIMEQEDFVRLKDAEIAALREEIDNLVAVVVARDKRIAELEEQVQRMTGVLDDVLGVARQREEAAAADIARQEQEAGL